MSFFNETKNINLIIHVEAQKTPKRKAIFSKRSNAGGITIPDFKLYHRAIITKAACY
jgi:hypothetical protein